MKGLMQLEARSFSLLWLMVVSKPLPYEAWYLRRVDWLSS